MFLKTGTIIIEIPALTALVEYWKATDQARIDELTKQVQDLVVRLQQSEATLARASQPK